MIPILTNIFQTGWNHQLVIVSMATGKIRKIKALRHVFCLNIFSVNMFQSLLDHTCALMRPWWNEFCDLEKILTIFILLGWWFRICLLLPLLGDMIQFDSYFWDGLKPPTRLWKNYGHLMGPWKYMKIYCLTDPIPVKVNEINQTNLTGCVWCLATR